MFKTATDTLGLSGTKRATVEPTSIEFKVSEFCKKCKDEVSGEHSLLDTTKTVVWQPTTTRLPAPKQSGKTRATSRVIVDKATARPAVRKRINEWKKNA